MNDLKLDNNYWKKHRKELTKYGDCVQQQNKKHDKDAKQVGQDAQEQHDKDE